MRDVKVVMARPDGRDERMTSDCVLSLAYGSDENSFKIETSPRQAPGEGWRVYVDGTQWGGVVDKVKATSGRDGSPRVVCSGRTWHGVLAGRRLRPDEGEARLVVSGEVGAVLASLVSRLGLGGLFEVEVNRTPVSYEFKRFADAYGGIRDMLAENGLKLVLRSEQGRVVMSAAKAEQVEVDGGVGVEIERTHRCVNHLVCAGVGEGEGRVVIDLYADADGNVGDVQTLFGVDEIEAYYDYNNADEAELRESGAEKLGEMQDGGSVSVTFPDGIEAEVGDVLHGIDESFGVSASAAVIKKIIKIDGGLASLSYEAGCENAVSTSNSTISGSAESSDGVSYVAGDGISISGGRISADVTRADLDAVGATAEDARKLASDASAAAGEAVAAVGGKADKGHTHPPKDLEAPVPIELGGTGAATRAAAWTALMRSTVRNWAAADWNEITEPGVYTTSSVAGANAPKGAHGYGILEVMAAGDVTTQRWMSDAGFGTFARQGWAKVDGSISWRAWVRIAYEGDVAPKVHTHPYAGSQSAGGAADSAVRLATARKITLAGAVSGSASFDGSVDVTITVEGDSAAAGFLAAHPVGFYVECKAGVDPNSVGGTWEQAPSVGPCVWLRTS